VLQPHVIFAVTTPTVAALLRETRALPIVFAQVSDPVGLGFVASLARSGGNVTGFTNINIESSIGGKWLGADRPTSGMGHIRVDFVAVGDVRSVGIFGHERSNLSFKWKNCPHSLRCPARQPCLRPTAAFGETRPAAAPVRIIALPRP
jgi:hypothetical protein